MIIAIDPGKVGGIAFDVEVVNEIEKKIYYKTQAFKMPQTDGDLIEFFDKHIPPTENNRSVCFMEKVGGFIGMRTKYILCPRCKNNIPIQSADPGSRMFVFGYGNGFLVSTIMTRKIPLELVTPQKWIKALGLGTKSGMPNTQWKNKLKAMAQRLYPDIKVTLNTSDALLILYYAKLLHKNNMIPALQQGGQSKAYSKKIHETYEGKPKEYTGQQELLEEPGLPF